MLDNGCIILCYHSLAVGNLYYNVALRECYVLTLIGSQSGKGCKICLRISIDRRSILIHGRCEPLLLACLTIFLGKSLKISAALQCSKDTVSCLTGSFSSFATHLNLTILDRIRSLYLIDELNDIHGIVIGSLEGSTYLTNLHRVEFCSNIGSKSTLGSCNTRIGNLRLSLTNDIGRSSTAL